MELRQTDTDREKQYKEAQAKKEKSKGSNSHFISACCYDFFCKAGFTEFKSFVFLVPVVHYGIKTDLLDW